MIAASHFESSNPVEETMSASWKWSRAFLVPVLVATVVSGCGISKAKYLMATQSADALTSKNAELQKNLQEANGKSDQLSQQVASMQASADQLNGELEKQKQSNATAHSTYEDMVAKLKQEVGSGQVEIQQMRDGIRVNLAQDILFKSGSSSLDPAGKALLTKVSEELKTSTYEVLVIGHTDNQKVGAKLAQRYPTNWELGAARSAAIVRLFQDAGIGPARLLAVSAGARAGTRP
ncbi:MAG: hypothetical protein E6K80_09880 [Candidatus Eisenbacteria bacterium]|uniref:OmpA-like domain-containing protein n=1 Tax=Eiseniibacteriota bacterium TaxID=2212470 RepID=A0A538U291_UNCEI|nr:MAG: hypothetical protein E6K80_09880 [Candidatus Eisenbacteria bacterium]